MDHNVDDPINPNGQPNASGRARVIRDLPRKRAIRNAIGVRSHE
jgi:hypothetical protein